MEMGVSIHTSEDRMAVFGRILCMQPPNILLAVDKCQSAFRTFEVLVIIIFGYGWGWKNGSVTLGW